MLRLGNFAALASKIMMLISVTHLVSGCKGGGDGPTAGPSVPVLTYEFESEEAYDNSSACRVWSISPGGFHADWSQESLRLNCVAQDSGDYLLRMTAELRPDPRGDKVHLFYSYNSYLTPRESQRDPYCEVLADLIQGMDFTDSPAEDQDLVYLGASCIADTKPNSDPEDKQTTWTLTVRIRTLKYAPPAAASLSDPMTSLFPLADPELQEPQFQLSMKSELEILAQIAGLHDERIEKNKSLFTKRRLSRVIAASRELDPTRQALVQLEIQNIGNAIEQGKYDDVATRARAMASEL